MIIYCYISGRKKMHSFLRTIGFSNITKKEFDSIIEEIIKKPEKIRVTKDSEGNEFAELSKDVSTNIGITVRGIYNEDDSFDIEYYYPYFIGTDKTTDEIIDIEKHSEKESYAGICDEPRLGVTLIFYLQNVSDYLSEKVYRNSVMNIKGAELAALSKNGCIILPIESKKTKNTYAKSAERSKLMADVIDGIENAMETLTLEDMDMYTLLSKRVVKEDILSIVSTYFMPYGIESDQYSVLADIIEVSEQKNFITDEILYCMKVSCNGIIFDVCINKNDLLGEPLAGRRFKGNIWMQGSICM